jgi:hypothetical protein
MTESEWQACADPLEMLEHLHGPPCVRPLRLFACACCRRLWPLLDDDALRRAVELAERFAEGHLSKAELADAAEAAYGAASRTVERWYGPRPGEIGEFVPSTARWHPAVSAALVVAGARSIRQRFGWVARSAAIMAERHARGEFRPGVRSSHRSSWGTQEAAAQAGLLRCVVCNPYRPVAFDPAWGTAEVVSLAESAYQERQVPSGELDPQRLAVLADALEEVGAGGELLAHLRSAGPHVRGCWAVDLVTGRG